MTRRISLLSGLIFSTAVGCGPSALVDYEVTGGLTGRGDGTDALHIESDGGMTLRSPDGRTRTAQLDDARLDDLLVKIDQARFEQLEPKYGSSAADAFIHEVSVRVDLATYHVAAADDAAIPQRLEIVLDTLHDIARTSFR